MSEPWSWIAPHRAALAAARCRLAPTGASDEALDALEVTLGVRLAPSVRAFYRISDGGSWKSLGDVRSVAELARDAPFTFRPWSGAPERTDDNDDAESAKPSHWLILAALDLSMTCVDTASDGEWPVKHYDPEDGYEPDRPADAPSFEARLLAVLLDDLADGDLRAAALERLREIDDAGAWAEILRARAYLEVDRRADAVAAFELAMRLATRDRTRACAQDGLGGVLFLRGELVAARAAYQRAIAHFRSLSEDAGELQTLSYCLDGLSKVELAAGDRDAAYRAAEESLAICRKLNVPGAPRETTQRLLLVLSTVGRLERERFRYAEARALAREAVAFAREFHASAPDVHTTDDLAISLFRLAEAEMEVSGYAPAYPLLVEATALRRQLHAQGDTFATLNLLAITRALEAEAAQAIGRHDAADEARTEAIALLRAARERHPDVPSPTRELAYALARSYRAKADPALFTEAQALAAELVARWPTPDHTHVRDWVDRQGRSGLERLAFRVAGGVVANLQHALRWVSPKG